MDDGVSHHTAPSIGVERRVKELTEREGEISQWCEERQVKEG